jgi:hypothetical protein
MDRAGLCKAGPSTLLPSGSGRMIWLAFVSGRNGFKVSGFSG